MESNHFSRPPSVGGSLKEKRNTGQVTVAGQPVLWLSAGGYNGLIRGLSYATHVKAESSGPTTLFGVHIIDSRAMPDNVALLLPSPINSMRPLLLNTDTYKERVMDYSLYRLIEYATEKGITLITLES